MAVLSLIHCRRSCVWYYTVSAVIFIMQIWTVHLTRATFFLFVWLIPASLFYTCSSCMIHELGGCWRVWCAISRIIKLSINDFCSQTNTCVAQWAAVSGVVHISYVLCPYRAVCTESLCACLRVCVRACVCLWNHLQFVFSIQVLLSRPISSSTFMSGCKTHATSHTASAFTHCTGAHRLIYQSVFFPSFPPHLVCSSSTPFHFGTRNHAQSTHTA